MVEKEVDIRKRILRDYNKKEEDFATLEEYNDYLEEIETLIFNLSNNIDIINTNKRIEQYKKENKDVILKNKQRIGRDEFELEQMLEIEKEQEEARKQELSKLEQENRRKKTQAKEALIDELMFSNEDGAAIVSHFAKQVEETYKEAKVIPPQQPKTTQFSSGIQFGAAGSVQSQFLPIPKQDEGVIFEYHSPQLQNNGPVAPKPDQLEDLGYMKYIRTELPAEKAGGYKSQLACLRALQEALQGLYS